jgi:hypothetical protein
MALHITPVPRNSVRVTCSCGFIDCLVHDVALGVVVDAVDSVENGHSCAA